MCPKIKCFIYCWEGVFYQHVLDYAYFIVDQLQNHNELGYWLDKRGGGWLLSRPAVSHPSLCNILKAMDFLHVGEIMQLAQFVDKYKSQLLVPHGMSNPRPLHYQVTLPLS